MKISVITICYNIKDEIEKTCESIVNQTYQNFEWIVIDGGSTDGTLDVLKKYNARIDTFISEKDDGIYDAMNKGIKVSKGDYLNFMNGGDRFYDNNSLADAEKYINDKDVYYGNTELFENNQLSVLTYPSVLNSAYFINHCINHQSTFIKRSLFETYGYYKTYIHILADWEKWVVFQKSNCSFMHIPATIATFDCSGISSQKNLVEKEKFEFIYPYFTSVEINNEQKRITKKLFLLFNTLPIIKIKKNLKNTRIKILGIPILKIRNK